MKKLNTDYFLESKNEKFIKTLNHCKKVADSDANVLLVGESGTGKEVLGRLIHTYGKRSRNNFVALNCSSYSDSLLESELFGHQQGSFTGAIGTKKGKIELSEHGTLFLDEIGDTPLNTQIKLLRVLETKEIERIGSNTPKSVDFRLISATNVDIKDAILSNKFREDFFYRVSTIVISIPPLRERPEDLNGLIEYFFNKAAEANGVQLFHIENEVNEFLHNYDYPGNIRELKNIIDRMVVFSDNGIITADGLPIMHSFYTANTPTKTSGHRFNKVISFQDFKHASEKEYLTWVLEQTNGNVAEASRKLQISTRQLFNKINALEIKK